MLNPKLSNIILLENEYKRYARHLIVNQIGSNGQKRLFKAKILLIGAGGLASPSIIYLAACGIGNIGIIDNDLVSESNLHRQILYNTNDLNNLKVQAAKSKINIINNKCKVTIYPYTLTINNAQNIIKNYDLIIDTTDNFTTRYLISSICYKLHKVHIFGAIQNFEGQISVFNYKNGIQYTDLYPEYLYLEDNRCNEIGVLGILPGIIGLLQGIEAIKIILGIGKILNGYLMQYNSLNMSFKTIKIQSRKINLEKDKNHLDIIKQKKSNSISKYTLKKIIASSNPLIIDIRQNIEFELSHIKNAINIPIKNIHEMHTIQFILYKSLKKILIIYCNDNSRSITVSCILDRYQINHYRLKNGFKEWKR
uniref:Probable molybdopterin-synthase adenylyltransferase n=1 Tax=Plocamium cartilagineum TaxID=31452 RepID=A0A1C9CI05_PLOCA|nr:molybdopterin biosynthesis protein [Plocamium cartilagineum]AOM67989.1 molybdopterin biosynthesis protein [Plocamium cartilagineum]